MTDRLLQFFAYAHLKPELQEVSRPFSELAKWIAVKLPQNPGRTIALRKLLEAKDCAVRAKLGKWEERGPPTSFRGEPIPGPATPTPTRRPETEMLAALVLVGGMAAPLPERLQPVERCSRFLVWQLCHREGYRRPPEKGGAQSPQSRSRAPAAASGRAASQPSDAAGTGSRQSTPTAADGSRSGPPGGTGGPSGSGPPAGDSDPPSGGSSGGGDPPSQAHDDNGHGNDPGHTDPSNPGQGKGNHGTGNSGQGKGGSR